MGQIQTAPSDGGNGGGGGALLASGPNDDISQGTVSGNYLGWSFNPYAAVDIHAMFLIVDTVAGNYRAMIAPFTEAADQLTADPTFGEAVTPGAGLSRAAVYMPFADPVRLTAGLEYVILGGLFSTGDDPSQNPYGSAGANFGFAMPGVTGNNRKLIDVAAPASGQSVVNIAGSQYGGGVIYSLV